MLPPELSKLHQELATGAGPMLNLDRGSLLHELSRLGPLLEQAVSIGALPRDFFDRPPVMGDVGPLPGKHCPHCGKLIP